MSRYEEAVEGICPVCGGNGRIEEKGNEVHYIHKETVDVWVDEDTGAITECEDDPVIEEFCVVKCV